jgi:hypothetical protein
MIIPEITIEEAAAVQPSKTWRLDLTSGRIRGGMIDGNTAVAQSAQCALLTERFAHIIHSWVYGSELQSLVGKDQDYIKAEAPRMIREALLQDDRVLSVSSFGFDGKIITFVMTTIYGTKEMAMEVMP